MKQAVLYVCHGSRVPKAREEAIEFISKVKPRINAQVQEVCFLELAEPSIEEGFKNCVSQGATDIAVIPLLLLTAAHAKSDIPEEVEHVSSLFPTVRVSYGKPIGVDLRLADMLVDKMNEKSPINSSSTAILVGRGSSDMDVVNDLNQIADFLQDKSGVKKVHTCFLTAAEPRFSQMIEDVFNSDEQSLFIIPYLIFTGLLKKEIDHTVKQYNWGDRKVEVCSYLGPHPILLDLFVERVHEAIDNTDGLYTFNKGKQHAPTSH
ncbi:sirohydrochlorin chelatase [Metabacillus litoralis]|uniref:sirohydrochlorin chelatase n=1 Tax=Metabacillus TaxID=2675233 RepID=UPI000EF5E36F|nr:sirohydrochlorin chelatase [Metabacillus litoralis]MCM3160437.1 sirohydrochlorin chelatase [Metabacillus litoralis]UHA59348.1 sirohydrochlorin chelatase [Metabacillus litoralis]